MVINRKQARIHCGLLFWPSLILLVAALSFSSAYAQQIVVQVDTPSPEVNGKGPSARLVPDSVQEYDRATVEDYAQLFDLAYVEPVFGDSASDAATAFVIREELGKLLNGCIFQVIRTETGVTVPHRCVS